MFTGIIQAVGCVTGTATTPAGIRLEVDPQGWGHRPEPGESISVQGVCLTCHGRSGSDPRLVFDVVQETLRRTTLGALEPGAPVNLERSLRADSLLGGHLVQGHVDGIATVERVATSPERRLAFRIPGALTPLIVPKGSVAVDGVSLTIAAADPEEAVFEVALIPTTLEQTTLGHLEAGSRVNIETDILARTVIHALARMFPIKA